MPERHTTTTSWSCGSSSRGRPVRRAGIKRRARGCGSRPTRPVRAHPG
ncbi:MAG: hypothetical protein MZV64_34995 [Ignavibacteriales bacterium]|nr:hypothetical protein [Ignavibacteriales bacterium]